MCGKNEDMVILNHIKGTRFEVVTAVTMVGTTFWIVTPCSLVEFQRFGGTYRFHLQD
jgi:hypothetical protein